MQIDQNDSSCYQALTMQLKRLLFKNYFSIPLLFAALIAIKMPSALGGRELPTSDLDKSDALSKTSCLMTIGRTNTNWLWWHIARSRRLRYHTEVGVLSQTPNLILELHQTKAKSEAAFQRVAKNLSDEAIHAIEAYFKSDLFEKFYDQDFVLRRSFSSKALDIRQAAFVTDNGELLLEALMIHYRESPKGSRQAKITFRILKILSLDSRLTPKINEFADRHLSPEAADIFFQALND